MIESENKRAYISLLFDMYSAVLTDRQRDALDLCYNDDLSLSESAEHMGMTRQGVRDAIKRGEEQLLFLESKLGFVQREMKYKDAAREIVEKTADPAAAEIAKKILSL